MRTEKAAVTAKTGGELPALPPKLRELAVLRKKYVDAVQALRTNTQRKLEPLQKELVRQLEALAVKMVRAGKADAAPVIAVGHRPHHEGEEQHRQKLDQPHQPEANQQQ